MSLLIVLMISVLLLDSCKTLKRDFYKNTLSLVQFLVDDCSLVYAEQTDSIRIYTIQFYKGLFSCNL